MNEKLIHFFDQVNKIDTQVGLPRIYRHLAVIRRLNKPVTGSGFSINGHSSILASMGEAIERYCAIISNEEIYEKYYPKIDIKSVTRATTDYDNITNRQWTDVNNLITGEKKLIPREMVYLNSTDYPPIRDIISTGLASYMDLEGAIERGLFECLERDAFVLFWMLSHLNFKIDKSSINDIDVNILLNKAENSGLIVDLYDITTEFNVPVILTVVKKYDKSGFYLSCAANFDYEFAIKKSLEEGLGGYSVYVEATLINNKPIPDNLNSIRDLSERPIYYLNKNQDELLEYILDRTNNANLIKKLPSVEINTIDNILNALEEHDVDIYYKDLTKEDVEKIGFKVVRVITPQLCFLPYGNPMLVSHRLNKKREELNRNFNLAPHPFP